MLTAFACVILGGSLEAKLRKEIPVDLLETPFSEAVDYVRRQSGLPIVLERRRLEKLLQAPVTFRARSIPAREALKWITRLAGADFEVGDRVITVSTLAAFMARRVRMEMYDVGDLVRYRPSFAGPEYIELGGLRSFALQPKTAAALQTGSIAELIQTRIRPATWAPELGTSIAARGSLLVVMQTPEVHAEIKRLLEELRREATRMIAVHVEEMVVPRPAVKKAVDESSSYLLTKAAADELRTKAFGRKSVSILCFDGQRASSHGGRMRSIVADYDVSGAAYDPVVRAVRTGLSAEAVPCLSGDGRAVLLSLIVRSCEEPEIVPFRPIEGLAGGEAGKQANVPGIVQLPRRKVTGFSAVFELPLGRSAFFSAGKGTRGFLVSTEVVRP